MKATKMTEANENLTTGSRVGFQLFQRCSESSATEESDTAQQNAIYITVTATALENVDTCRVKDIIVKMEFDGETLSQSEKIKVRASNVDVELTGVLQADDADGKYINSILGNPVLFTVYDCSTPTAPGPPSVEKSDKKKTAKTTASRASLTGPAPSQAVLGICNLDVGILLTEKKTIRESLILEMDKNASVKNSVSWNKLPRLVVVAFINEDEVPTQYINELNNVVGITVESAYNLPEHMMDGGTFDAIITMPSFGDKSNSILFPGGNVVSLKDSDARKKWCSLQHRVEGRGGRTNQLISDGDHDVISSLPNDVDLQKEMNKNEPRIEWNSWKRCLLSRSDSSYFCSKLTKYHVWPVEISVSGRANAQKAGKADKKSKPALNDGPSNADRFSSFLNFSSLLYPGVTKVRAAAQLFTYSQADLATRFGLEFPPSNSQSSMRAVSKSKAVSERAKTSAKDFEEKKEESPGKPVTNKYGLPTFVIVEIELGKPFTRPKSPEYLEKDLRSYVSLKGKAPKKAVNISMARESYSNAIQDLISVMSGEYTNFVQSEKNKKIELNNLNSAFHNYLRCSESYNEAIMCLESKVMSFVNEKYGKLQRYNERIPEIYAGLVEEMHKITNGDVFGLEDSPDGCFQMFADEALEEGEYELAKTYLLQNITRHRGHPDFWVDYAVFSIRMQDYETALEATREALSLDTSHQLGLLVYGSLMATLRHGTVGETAFLFLTTKYPYFIEGWKTFHFFHVIFQNYEGGDATLQMSVKLEYERRNEEQMKDSEKAVKSKSNKFECRHYGPPDNYALSGEGKYGAVTFVKGLSWTEPLAWTTSFCPPDSINMRTVVLMLKLGLFEFASMGLAEELLTKRGTICPQYQYYLSVSHYLQGRYDEAIRQLEIAVKEFGKDFALWSLMGHCFYKIRDHGNALACYEYVMESYNRPDDIHLIYLRMGFYYLERGKPRCAKQVFATGCKYSPSPRMWKGAGMACLQLNEYEEAETAFGEANHLDNKDPETWGYLALVSGYLRRANLLTHCYAEAKKRNLGNQKLLEAIERCINLNSMEMEK